MKIVDVKATAVNVPAEFSSCGKTKEATLGICVVEVTTDDGLVGVGMTA
ncbi:MAG: mandelate racemase, partial [Thalassobium sp.]